MGFICRNRASLCHSAGAGAGGVGREDVPECSSGMLRPPPEGSRWLTPDVFPFRLSPSSGPGSAAETSVLVFGVGE